MTRHDKEHQDTENQEFITDESFDAPADAPTGDGEACANMAGEADSESAPELTAEEEAAIWKDKYMRLSAEYENYRKRTLKEKLELISTGGEDVVRSMLEVLDDMDRALAAMDKTGDMEAVKQGIVLIDDKLRGTLRGRGLAEIEAVGQQLDADLHEAIARIEVAEADMKGRIIDIVQKGYKLKDKIIRYPKVVVGQ